MALLGCSIVGALEALSGAVPAELPDHLRARGLPETSCRGPIGEQPFEGSRQGLGIAFGHEDTCNAVGDRLRQAADTRGDDRRGRREGFEREVRQSIHVALGIVDGRYGDDVGGRRKIADLILVPCTDEGDDAACPPCSRVEFVTKIASAGNQDAHAANARRELAGGVDQVLKALLAHQATGAEDERGVADSELGADAAPALG